MSRRRISTTTASFKWVAAAALISFSLSACNTIQGAGKDIETAGEEIQETAEDAKN